MSNMVRGAEFDPTGHYRYHLWRIWDLNKLRITWIMLNPSTADGQKDDATIRRVIGFSKLWGFGGADIFNIFALKSTDPHALLRHGSPIGPANDFKLRVASTKTEIIAAWGSWGDRFPDRVKELRQILFNSNVYCLGRTKNGQPLHPLRLPNNTSRIKYISSQELAHNSL